MKTKTTFTAVLLATLAPQSLKAQKTPAPLDYDIQRIAVLTHDDGEFLWFHPRTAAVPNPKDPLRPAVVMTLQKHLKISDYYSGLYVMRTDDLGQTWTAPDPRPELAWTHEPAGVVIAVADVTPNYHPQTKKVIAVGAKVRYNTKGEQIEDTSLAHQTDYAVHDPTTGSWTKWKPIEMPREEKFNFARSACAQWHVQPDGSLLLPFYYSASAKTPHSVTVVHASFDGETIKYLSHGTELTLNVVRGLVEPSIAYFNNRYYLTIRNDEKAYITASDDGLSYAPIKPWTFDDGAELGSYNTQQHWLAHSDALFLVYTRRGADNDHIFRHRAPLFIARVDPVRLVVLRKTERILIPEIGATLGNFGASPISQNESWVTVNEGLWNQEARKRGAKGTLHLAKIIWKTPNKLVTSTP
jgi:hypothetical protein